MRKFMGQEFESKGVLGLGSLTVSSSRIMEFQGKEFKGEEVLGLGV